MKIFNNKTGFYFTAFIVFFVLLFAPALNTYADLKGYRDDLINQLKSATDSDQKSKLNAKIDMTDRQISVDQSFANLKDRVKAMISDDPRKDKAEGALGNAGKAVINFMKDPETFLLTDPYRSNEAFNSLEKDALDAISAVNSELLAPAKPGNVPSGDLINDFIPGIIRILFRFASLAVFVSFVISGVMFVMAFGVEERVTKAKHMLYYTLIGFAFITLAFAVVKAVTNIDFFGFI